MSRHFRRTAIQGSLCSLLALCCCRVLAQDHVFVPSFSAKFWIAEPPSGESRSWTSQVYAFNLGPDIAVVRRVAVYVSAGYPPAFPEEARAYPPGTGDLMPVVLAGQPFFNEFIVPPGVRVSAEVEKRHSKTCTIDSGGNPITAVLGQGRVPLPVYQGLFPADSPVVSGTIALGNPELNPLCGGNALQYMRRVNVTLLNAGDAPGTFSIKVLPLRKTPTPIYEASVTLAAREVRQINRLPIPVIASPESSDVTGVLVWMVVTCDQPFLGYASTIFDDPEPGAQPFEVFAFKKGS